MRLVSAGGMPSPELGATCSADEPRIETSGMERTEALEGMGTAVRYLVGMGVSFCAVAFSSSSAIWSSPASPSSAFVASCRLVTAAGISSASVALGLPTTTATSRVRIHSVASATQPSVAIASAASR